MRRIFSSVYRCLFLLFFLCSFLHIQKLNAQFELEWESNHNFKGISSITFGGTNNVYVMSINGDAKADVVKAFELNGDSQGATLRINKTLSAGSGSRILKLPEIFIQNKFIHKTVKLKKNIIIDKTDAKYWYNELTLFDKSGKELSTVDFEAPNRISKISNIFYDNSHFYLIGTKGHNLDVAQRSEPIVFMVKLNYNGDIIWERTVHIPFPYNEKINNLSLYRNDYMTIREVDSKIDIIYLNKQYEYTLSTINKEGSVLKVNQFKKGENSIKAIELNKDLTKVFSYSDKKQKKLEKEHQKKQFEIESIITNTGEYNSKVVSESLYKKGVILDISYYDDALFVYYKEEKKKEEPKYFLGKFNEDFKLISKIEITEQLKGKLSKKATLFTADNMAFISHKSNMLVFNCNDLSMDWSFPNSDLKGIDHVIYAKGKLLVVLNGGAFGAAKYSFFNHIKD
ncbi:hypothetical protein [Seonamhaeicola marinus]|uniref:Uncharacterized protein n=1 Tax=Seonamhaeicola marinus TaxID=1912246 RepID=A0A5D0I4B9_9FLAO|nr:hypothetical protein [Seonamhaeicola marinus]TYA78573.1 hypothetical protein FUA24_09470 [Seonamhaeicola marinus]